MFAVIFEVHPRPEQWSAYLGQARMLRPELERIAGFIDNLRYASLTRPGWLLSLSSWRDEKAVVRWRTQAAHHVAQQRGRDQILLDYHLRVGELTRDTQLPPGHALIEQRLDETRVGDGTTAVLIDARWPGGGDDAKVQAPERLARWLGLAADAPGLLRWDVFDAILSPGDLVLLLSWRDAASAEAFDRRRGEAGNCDGRRFRRVRVVRDYGMADRREAPQYFPDTTPGSPPV